MELYNEFEIAFKKLDQMLTEEEKRHFYDFGYQNTHSFGLGFHGYVYDIIHEGALEKLLCSYGVERLLDMILLFLNLYYIHLGKLILKGEFYL